jgi:hypothetical protein
MIFGAGLRRRDLGWLRLARAIERELTFFFHSALTAHAGKVFELKAIF